MDVVLTDATTPEEDPKDSILQSPSLTPAKLPTGALKREESDASLLEIAVSPSTPDAQDSISVAPLPMIEVIAKAKPVATSPTTDEMDEASESIVVLPPLAKPATLVSESTQVIAPILDSPESASSSHGTSAKRGRPRGRPSKAEIVETEDTDDDDDDDDDDDEFTPPSRTRTPGDYILTTVLLSEPNTAWIHCTICSEPFVQYNAYFTRSSCPRCERHSKLYGYQWPKTEKEGKHDKEERVLDHRLIHRFLTAEDEAKIRGRKFASTSTATTPSNELPEKRARGRPRKVQSVPNLGEERGSSQDDESSGIRRSTRRRQPSLKAVC